MNSISFNINAPVLGKRKEPSDETSHHEQNMQLNVVVTAGNAHTSAQDNHHSLERRTQMAFLRNKQIEAENFAQEYQRQAAAYSKMLHDMSVSSTTPAPVVAPKPTSLEQDKGQNLSSHDADAADLFLNFVTKVKDQKSDQETVPSVASKDKAPEPTLSKEEIKAKVDDCLQKAAKIKDIQEKHKVVSSCLNSLLPMVKPQTEEGDSIALLYSTLAQNLQAYFSYDKAIEALCTALTWAVNKEVRVRIFGNLGIAYELRNRPGDLTNALQTFQQGKNLNPSDPTVSQKLNQKCKHLLLLINQKDPSSHPSGAAPAKDQKSDQETVPSVASKDKAPEPTLSKEEIKAKVNDCLKKAAKLEDIQEKHQIVSSCLNSLLPMVKPQTEEGDSIALLYSTLAQNLQARVSYHKAIKALCTALAWAVNKEVRAKIFGNLGIAYEKRNRPGDLTNALQTFQQGKNLNPSDPTVSQTLNQKCEHLLLLVNQNAPSSHPSGAAPAKDQKSDQETVPSSIASNGKAPKHTLSKKEIEVIANDCLQKAAEVESIQRKLEIIHSYLHYLLPMVKPQTEEGDSIALLYSELAKCFKTLSAPDTALQALRTALKWTANEELRVRIFGNVGIAYEERKQPGDLQNALKAYQTGQSLKPSDPTIAQVLHQSCQRLLPLVHQNAPSSHPSGATPASDRSINTKKKVTRAPQLTRAKRISTPLVNVQEAIVAKRTPHSHSLDSILEDPSEHIPGAQRTKKKDAPPTTQLLDQSYHRLLASAPDSQKTTKKEKSQRPAKAFENFRQLIRAFGALVNPTQAQIDSLSETYLTQRKNIREKRRTAGITMRAIAECFKKAQELEESGTRKHPATLIDDSSLNALRGAKKIFPLLIKEATPFKDKFLDYFVVKKKGLGMSADTLESEFSDISETDQ